MKYPGFFSRAGNGLVAAVLLAGMMLMILGPASAQMAGAPQEDIRDIRGIIPMGSLEWWIYAGGLIALAGIVIQIFLLKRKRPAAVEPESPESVAFRELEEARKLLVEGMAREFSLDVSEVLRRYIEERFHVPVVQRTTEEFLRDMRRSQLAGVLSHLDELDLFLKLCDQAKFGREALTLSEMETMWDSARRFVDQTGLALALGQSVQNPRGGAPAEVRAL